MNTPVKFETSKLLKEKGFDYHLLYNDFADYYDYFDKSVQGRLHVSDFPEDKFPDENKWTPVPYIYQVIIWLYKKHGIWIISSYELNIENHKKEWFWIAIKDGEEIAYQYRDFNLPTEAYEAAIEFTLKNLI